MSVAFETVSQLGKILIPRKILILRKIQKFTRLILKGLELFFSLKLQKLLKIYQLTKSVKIVDNE